MISLKKSCAGFFSRICRCSFFTDKDKPTRPRRSTIVVSRMTLFHNMVLPIIFVGFDMSSDASVILTMGRFIVSSKTKTWVAIVIVSLLILVISTISLLLSDPMGTLMASVKTTESMKSQELEREDVPVSLGQGNAMHPFAKLHALIIAISFKLNILFYFMDKMVELFGGRSVINEAYPVY